MNPATQHMPTEGLRNQPERYGLRYDPITGLANAMNFRVSIRQLLADARQLGTKVTLVWIDVLNLRREYLIGGDSVADQLVCRVADSLLPWIGKDELVCRFSDDSFLLALQCDERDESRLGLILDSASHLHLRGTEGKPEIAAGVAFFPEHASYADDLIRFASIASASASRTRSNTAIVFHPEMNAALLYERSLEKDLRAALRENQLSLVYQPQIDLATGNVLGVESLTRWTHPVRGSVSPAEFIPVAERSNLIDEVFMHSLRRLLADAAAWRREGIVLPSIAVNASAANIRQADFVRMVERELSANPLGTTQLDIEVTESLLMDDEDLFRERLTALRAIGVKVSLDDFGTRYTGFNSLKELPLNSMKIDKCFVHGVEQSDQAQSLCRTIVMMARQLKLSAVAEGIEEIGELRALKKIGCQAGQGYLFQRPVPSDQFLQFLREWPERKRQAEFADAFLDIDVNPRYEVDPLFGVV
jgi:predicted signal transduction protein with EAL and GGDEF domain